MCTSHDVVATDVMPIVNSDTSRMNPEVLWQQCEATVPALVSPLRAIFWMLGLVFVPHLLKVPVILRGKGTYNLMHPRDQAEKGYFADKWIADVVKRAFACHYNSWEAFSYFSAAAVMAHVCKLDQHQASKLATAFLACRIVYIPLYMFGSNVMLALGRSTVWLAGLVIAIRMMLLSLQHAGL